MKFPVCREGLNPSLGRLEIVNELKETKWKRDRTLGDIQIEEQLLDHAKFQYEIKKRAFLQFMAERSLQMSQTQVKFSVFDNSIHRSESNCLLEILD